MATKVAVVASNSSSKMRGLDSSNRRTASSPWSNTATATTNTTSSRTPPPPNEIDDNWPCPEREACSYHRRPSWQAQEQQQQQIEQEEKTIAHITAATPTNLTPSHHKLHNPFALSLRSLPLRAVSPASSSKTGNSSSLATPQPSTAADSSATTLKVPQPHHHHTSHRITFLSPFEASFNSSFPVPAVEAPLSPFCLPGSPFTDMESLASSSPGLATPSSMASLHAGSPCYCCGSSASSSSTAAAAPALPRDPYQPIDAICDLCAPTSTTASSAFASTSTHPYNNNTSQQHLSGSPPHRVHYGARSGSYQPTTNTANNITTHPDQPSLHVQTADNLAYRRRSVDVGTLGNARGHQKFGRTSQADAPAAAFVPPDQLKAHRARKSVNQRNKEYLFAQHLTSILRHSLSLCSIVAPDADIEAWSNAASPRSSISSNSSNGLPSISDRLEAPVRFNSSNNLPRRIRLPSLPHILPSRRVELIEMLSNWSFDANLLDLDELCECACIIFECFLQSDGLLNINNNHNNKDAAGTTTINKWRTFLISLRAAYHPQNAYHNFAHAVDVLQACYSFLSQIGVAPPLSRLLQQEQERKGQGQGSATSTTSYPPWKRAEGINEKGRIGDILRPMDVLALLVAAIGHDVGHPGLTNAYMINARTPAAQVYNDKSVLENFHSVTLIRMLKIHGFGNLLEESSILQTPTTPASPSTTPVMIESSQGTDFRQVLLTSVLVTDMSRHFPFVEKLTQMGERLAKNNYISTDVTEDRLTICSALMKCADISNPSRPHSVASFWSSALLEEWAVQAEIEAKFELPISVVTLKSDERIAQAKSQVGFINLFTQPLFDKLAAAVPSFQIFADYCKAGRTPWEIILKEADEVKSGNTTAQVESPASSNSSSQSALSRAITSPPPPSSLSYIKIPEYKPAPHRLPWSAKTSEFPYDSSAPLSPSTTSIFSTSPSTASSLLFKDDRSSASSAATTFSSSSSSWIPSNTVEAYHPLVEEACTDNCSSITALCASCARRQAQNWNDDEEATVNHTLTNPQVCTTSSALIASGQWPPEPFRPSPQAKIPKK